MDYLADLMVGLIDSKIVDIGWCYININKSENYFLSIHIFEKHLRVREFSKETISMI